ncbi:MAG: branched-chain amino acid ABC transporter permease [Chloroflexi bacterium]|nr:branched-chain amino acid ABC transporter permease [Chloroflexota bacterium]
MSSLVSRHAVSTLLALLVLVALPAFISSSILTVLTFTFVWLVLAANYDVLGGYLGYTNLGQGAFFGLGAYTSVVALNFDPIRSLGPVAIIAAGLIGIIVTLVFAYLVAFPLFRLRGAYFAIVTVTMVLLLQVLVLNFANITGGSYGIYVPQEHYVPMNVAYYLALVLAAISVLINYGLSRSKTGIALQSIRDDEEAASAIGIPVFRYKQIAFMISSAPSAAIGVVFSVSAGYIDHNMALGLERTLLPSLIAMLGGTGTVLGPVVGAVLIRTMDTVFFHYVALPIPSLVFYGLILMFMGLFLPEGVLNAPVLRGLLRPGSTRKARPRVATPESDPS